MPIPIRYLAVRRAGPVSTALCSLLFVLPGTYVWGCIIGFATVFLRDRHKVLWRDTLFGLVMGIPCVSSRCDGSRGSSEFNAQSLGINGYLHRIGVTRHCQRAACILWLFLVGRKSRPPSPEICGHLRSCSSPDIRQELQLSFGDLKKERLLIPIVPQRKNQ